MKAPGAFHLTGTPLVAGPSLIEASAGTGKTYAITALVIRLILEKDLSIREILVVTYTDAATQELRDRIRQALVQAAQAFGSGLSDVPFLRELLKSHQNNRPELAARLHLALAGFDEAPIFTIHSFCQRTLRDRAFDSGLLFDMELVTDPLPLLREVADDFWRKNFYEASAVLVQFALKNQLGPHSFLDLLRTTINYPHLEFLSQAKDQSLDALSARLESQFQAARALWLGAHQEIRACFGSTIKWGNRPYNSDECMTLLYEELDTCFSIRATAFEALGCLESFCSAALKAKRNNKSKNPPPVPTHPFFDLCGEVCVTEKLWLARLSLAFVDYARQEMPQRKAERKIQFYDDLLTRLDQALAGPFGDALAKHLRHRYRAALIDEFQDTDPTQYQIFRRAFVDGNTYLFMIGDPKQAIYGFRGADIFTYLQAANEAARRFTLGENWRSESGLVQGVNSVFNFKPKAFVFDRIQFQDAVPKGRADSAPLYLDGKPAPPLQVWLWEQDEEIPKKDAHAHLPGIVAAEIVTLLNGDCRLGPRQLKPEDIAVLVLENRQAALIQEALNAVRVPNVLHTTASLFGAEEALELQRILAGIASPGNEPLVRSALATSLLGVDGSQIDGFTDVEWQQWLEKFHASLAVWNHYGFFRMFRECLRREEIRARLLAFPNGERRLTNLLHLGEVLHQAESQDRLGVSGLLKWLGDQIAAEGEAPEEHQLRLERDENAVRIVTVHKSKGLEYPVVFCPFSWKSSEIKRGSEEQVFFHDPKHEFRLVRDLGPDIAPEHQEAARQEKLAENVRLLYVALTRAKHRCYFVWGKFRGAGSSAPAWLFHRPDQPDEGGVDALIAAFGELGGAAMRQHLEAMAARSGGFVQISTLPELAPVLYQPDHGDPRHLQVRPFNGGIRRDWVISSFTGLTAGQQAEAPDRDAVEPGPKDAPPGTGLFAFPRGVKAGTCLHDILERFDFAGDETVTDKLVRERLQARSLLQEGAADAVGQMLRGLSRIPLTPGKPDFQLGQIPATDRLVELEFYFPIRQLLTTELAKLLADFGWESASGRIGRVTFDPVQGYLKGFIDLVFRWENQFYLVDWKSNWLGNTIDDYAQPALRAEMIRHQYHLQYHLYTVALHKFLALRLPGYHYEQHFGGVFYVFLRGIDHTKPECGIFRARPTLPMIEQLSALLAGAPPPAVAPTSTAPSKPRRPRP